MERRFVPVIHGATTDRADEVDTITTAAALCDSLRRSGYASKVIHVGSRLHALSDLPARAPFAVFNLVEAIDGQGGRAVEAVRRLEALGFAFTGASAAAYETSNCKLTTKAVLQRAGLPTPPYWLGAGDTPPADATLIIKSVDEHGSLGIDQGSVVPGRSAQDEIAKRQLAFGGRFFAEAYVEGREFNVSVLETSGGPRILPIAEIDFTELSEGHLPIVDFAAKWDVDAAAYHLTPRKFGLEAREPKLADEIERLTRACWDAFEMAGYGRVDFRVDAKGAPLILEVNANPCLARDAGFAAAAHRAGLSYDGVIAAIVSAAGRRTARVPECVR